MKTNIVVHNPYSAAIDFRQHNLTSVDVDYRTVRVNICILIVHRYHRYSKESERDD